MTKYVKLSDDRTQWESALFNVKPIPLRRHDDSLLPSFNWFTVQEHKEPLPDRELYTQERTSWELIDDVVHVTYTPILVNVERRREVLSRRCTELRNRKLRGGLSFMGHRFDTEQETYTRILGASIKASRSPEAFSIDWITEDNTTVTMNAEQFMMFGDVFASFEEQHIMYARSLKDQIEASETPETIDYTQGWPSTEFHSDMSL